MTNCLSYSIPLLVAALFMSATGYADTIEPLQLEVFEFDKASRTEMILDGAIVPFKRTLLDTLIADAASFTSCAPNRFTTRHVLIGTRHSPVDVLFVDGCRQRTVYVHPASNTGNYPRIEFLTLSRVSLQKNVTH